MLCRRTKEKIQGGMNKNKRREEQEMPGQKEDKVNTKTQVEAQGITKIRIHKSHKSLLMEFTVNNDTFSSIKKWPAQWTVHYN